MEVEEERKGADRSRKGATAVERGAKEKNIYLSEMKIGGSLFSRESNKR